MTSVKKEERKVEDAGQSKKWLCRLVQKLSMQVSKKLNVGYAGQDKLTICKNCMVPL